MSCSKRIDSQCIHVHCRSCIPATKTASSERLMKPIMIHFIQSARRWRGACNDGIGAAMLAVVSIFPPWLPGITICPVASKCDICCEDDERVDEWFPTCLKMQQILPVRCMSDKTCDLTNGRYFS